MKIKIKDSKTLLDSINVLKKKIRDAEPDYTKAGMHSIGNALIEKKEEISNTKNFAELRDIVKEVIGKFNSPKAKEYLLKVDEYDRLYQRDPRPGSRNDYWVWEKLMKYVWNIILAASGHRSPDVKKEEVAEVKEEEVKKDAVKEEKDSKEVKDESEILQLARLLGEAHDKIIEAQDLAGSLEGEDKISSALVYAIEDIEAPLSELDFMGESKPEEKLLEEFGSEEASEEVADLDEEDWL